MLDWVPRCVSGLIRRLGKYQLVSGRSQSLFLTWTEMISIDVLSHLALLLRSFFYFGVVVDDHNKSSTEDPTVDSPKLYMRDFRHSTGMRNPSTYLNIYV